MKLFSLALMTFALFCATVPQSMACRPGDKTKVLLVVADAADGEEDKVIAEVSTANGNVAMTTDTYFFVNASGNFITVQDLERHKLVFDRRNAKTYRSFCSEVVFPNQL